MPGTTIFRAARVWDGVADTPIADGFVRVEGHVIDAVGRWTELGGTPRSDATQIVECGDATLLPGLINSHVHLTLSASMTVLNDYLQERERGIEALIARAVDNVGAALFAGVTTVRDCGTLNEVAFVVRNGVEAGQILGSRVVTCGAGLTTTGGHCHFFGIEADDTNALRAAVRAQARAGADFIKVFATGGNLTPGTDPFRPQYDATQLRAVVEAAHDVGLRVAAHAHAPEGIANAITAGVDTIEHCFFETAGGIAYDQRVVDQIAERRVWVCPTAGARSAAMSEKIAGILAENPHAGRLLGRMGEIRRNFGRMFDAGVLLIAGSDAGAIPGFEFGNYPMAVATMADATDAPVGLAPVDALRSATSLAADACGLADTGRLAPGLRADIIAARGNPFDRMTDLERVSLVVRNGDVVKNVLTAA